MCQLQDHGCGGYFLKNMCKYPYIKTCVRCHQKKDRKFYKQGLGSHGRSNICNDCSPAVKKYRYGSTLVVKDAAQREKIESKNFIPPNSYYRKLADETIREETVQVDHKE